MAKTGGKKVTVLILAMAVLAGQAFAGPGGRGRGPRGGPVFGPGMPGPQVGAGLVSAKASAEARHPMMLRWILQGLDLTDEQIEAIKQVHETNKEAMQAAQKAVGEGAKALHEAVLQGNEADIRAAATNLGNAIGQCALLRAATMASIKAVLTAEQQAKLEQLQSRMKQHVLGPGQQMQDPDLPGFLLGFGHRRGAGPGAWQGPRPGGLWPHGPGPGWGLDIDRLFELKDTNKDGKLTLEELQAGGLSCNLAAQEIFNKIDTDGDGALSVKELEKFKEQIGNRPGRPW